jgi:hypothetical protein
MRNRRASAWSYKSARSVGLTVQGTTPAFQGLLQHSGAELLPAGYASDFDILVDFSQTSLAIGAPGALDATVYIALYAQCLNIQKYRAQFGLNPTTGAFVSTVPSGTAENGQVYQDGNGFLIQARDTAALVWGVQIGIAGSIPGFTMNKLFVGSIAHGIERSQ